MNDPDVLRDHTRLREMCIRDRFIGIGAMIDFGPLLANPKLLLFGAAAQFGICMTLTLACLVNLIFPGMFIIQDAASVAIIGAADGPTSIFVGNFYGKMCIRDSTGTEGVILSSLAEEAPDYRAEDVYKRQVHFPCAGPREGQNRHAAL